MGISGFYDCLGATLIVIVPNTVSLPTMMFLIVQILAVKKLLAPKICEGNPLRSFACKAPTSSRLWRKSLKVFIIIWHCMSSLKFCTYLLYFLCVWRFQSWKNILLFIWIFVFKMVIAFQNLYFLLSVFILLNMFIDDFFLVREYDIQTEGK